MRERQERQTERGENKRKGEREKDMGKCEKGAREGRQYKLDNAK